MAYGSTPNVEMPPPLQIKGGQKIDDLPVLALAGLVLWQYFPAKLTVLLLMEALNND